MVFCFPVDNLQKVRMFTIDVQFFPLLFYFYEFDAFVLSYIFIKLLFVSFCNSFTVFASQPNFLFLLFCVCIEL